MKLYLLDPFFDMILYISCICLQPSGGSSIFDSIISTNVRCLHNTGLCLCLFAHQPIVQVLLLLVAKDSVLKSLLFIVTVLDDPHNAYDTTPFHDNNNRWVLMDWWHTHARGMASRTDNGGGG